MRLPLLALLFGGAEAASCPASIASPTWSVGNSTGLRLDVDAATGCFTVAVDGTTWLASSHLLLSAGGTVYRQPHMPSHHALTPQAHQQFSGTDGLGPFDALSISWASGGKEPAWSTTFRVYGSESGSELKQVVFA